MFGNSEFTTTGAKNNIFAKRLVSDQFNYPCFHFIRAAVSNECVWGRDSNSKQELNSAAQQLDKPWGPPCLLYNGYRRQSGPGRGVNHVPPYNDKDKERVEL
jgi:hypothetical protein